MLKARSYTEFDNALLRELTRPHVTLLLGKNNDADSILLRKAAWEAIFTKYNETEYATKTTLKNLKRKWDRLVEKDSKTKMTKPTPNETLNPCVPCNDVGHLTPQVQLQKVVVNLGKRVTRPYTDRSVQSEPARPIVKAIVSADQEMSVMESDESLERPADREKALRVKLLLRQLRYHRRKIEIMELEHQLKKEILDIKKKKLHCNCNADNS